MLAVLHEPRFADLAPAEVYATLLDEGVYLCSERTMYRVLAENDEVRERRNQLRHPNHPVPELLATKPNQLWSWDITKLLGPAKWTYFYLYVVIDVFSRYVVGWMVAHRETATLAEKLIETLRAPGDPAGPAHHPRRPRHLDDLEAGRVSAGGPRRHQDPLAASRLERQPVLRGGFKTLKYRPNFPERFGSIEDARGFCVDFFPWYNEEHHHSGIAMLTPSDVHHGRAEARLAERNEVMRGAYAARPERFVRGAPRPPPAERGLDQQAGSDARGTEDGAVNSDDRCLIHVDRFRRDCLLLLKHQLPPALNSGV